MKKHIALFISGLIPWTGGAILLSLGARNTVSWRTAAYSFGIVLGVIGAGIMVYGMARLFNASKER